MSKKDKLFTANEDTAKATSTLLDSLIVNNKTSVESESKLNAPKRIYRHFKSKENKTHTITLRLTEKQYNELIKAVDNSESGTISNYISRLIERGL